MRAAVIGHPIQHSLSPAIFSFLARQLGKSDLDYQARDVAPEALDLFLQEIKSQDDFVGCNVTIPHKEKVFGALDRLSPEAEAVGAVNVVHHHGRTLTGHNTDVIGVQASLAEHQVRVRDRGAVLLGAGGAARAAAFALGRMGAASVFVLNRTAARAEALAADMRTRFPETRFIAGGDAGSVDLGADVAVIVQSTPYGMQGFGGDMGWVKFVSDELLQRFAVREKDRGTAAFDMVYRPLETEFMKEALALVMPVISGLDMLVHQALATWEIWFGPLANKGRLKVALADDLAAKLGGRE